MKIIITGSRDYKGNVEDAKWLESKLNYYHCTELVHGGATGVDSFGAFVASKMGIPTKAFDADWNTYDPSAGPKRNEEMALYGDMLIAFKGNKGTLNMINQAKKHKRPIIYRDTK